MSDEETPQSTQGAADQATEVVRVEQAPPVRPDPAPPVTPFRLRGGIRIIYIVLAMTTMSIMFFGVYLWCIDLAHINGIDHVVNRVFTLAASRTEGPDPAKIDSALSYLNGLRGSLPPPTSSEVAAVKGFLEELPRTSSVTQAQAKRLAACADTPDATMKTSPEKIDDCILILETLKEIGRMRGTEIERMRLVRDLTKEAREHHQNSRAFWLQGAQLILLNLLLPIITALLGYIFGSHQDDRQST